MENTPKKKFAFPIIVGIVAVLGAVTGVATYFNHKKKWGDFNDEF